jgi:sulfur transfer protein SufE
MSNNRKIYHVTESEIVQISGLFGCLEDAIKEIIRSQQILQQDDPPIFAQMRLKEEIFNIRSQSSPVDAIDS